MKIRFWGVRGSIASPGPDTTAVGGNTSCIELVCDKERIILDCGTGLRSLGNHLVASGAAGEALAMSVLLSHYHWDHIQGLPFFVPLYMRQTTLTVVGGANGIASVRETLEQQMSAPVFPVRLGEVGARIATREVTVGDPFAIGEVVVRAARGHHPGGVLAYRIEFGGKSIVYATDTEHYACVDPALRALSEGADVLVYGLFARAIHVNSERQAGPFVTVDCTTLPSQLVESELFGHERGAFTGADRRVPGRVELAEGGTLFLDEIGDLPLDVQGKLLRFLQDRAFERVGGRQTMTADARVVCATHQHLEERVKQGRFREDLYYRIRVVEIELPPLRARGQDEIEQLAVHFADTYAKRYRRPSPLFTPDALAVIRSHAWPGNVRELEHWVESAIVLAPDGRITAGHLPRVRRPVEASAETGAVPLGLTLEEATRRYVSATIDACEGNKAEAARRLDIGRNTIGRIVKGDRDGSPGEES